MPTTVSVAEALAAFRANPASKSFAIGDTVAAVSANIDALQGLSAAGGTVTIALTNGATAPLTLSVAEALNDQAALADITPPFTVRIVDTIAHIEALTAAQIATLGAQNVKTISVSHPNATLTVAQTAALTAQGIALKSPDFSAQMQLLSLIISDILGYPVMLPTPAQGVTLSDSAAQIGAMSTTQIAGLREAGVRAIETSGAGTVTLKVAQAAALAAEKIKISVAASARVIVSDTAANIATLTSAQIAQLGRLGLDRVVSTDDGVSLSLAKLLAYGAAGITLAAPTGKRVTATDTAANIEALSVANLTRLATTGAKQITASDAGVTLSFAQTTAFIGLGVGVSVPASATIAAKLSGVQLDGLTTVDIGALDALGVSKLIMTSGAAQLTAAEAVALETAGISIERQNGASVTIVDTAANIHALTTVQLDALGVLGITEIRSSDASLSFNQLLSAVIANDHLILTAPQNQTVTETFATGSTIVYSDIGASGRVILGGDSLTVTSGATTLTVSDGAQTFSLFNSGSEIFDANGHASETFIFQPHFGHDTIVGFDATGAGLDKLTFDDAAFGVTNPAATQAEKLAALLSHTADNGAGAAVITDIYGDTLTLNGVNKTTLATADFTFV